MARHHEDSTDGFIIEEACLDLTAQLGSCCISLLWRTMGTRLSQRVIDVGCCQDTDGHGKQRCRDATMIARAIQPLVMLRGNDTYLPKSFQSGEHTLSVVGMQAHSLPLRLRKRP